MMLTKTNIGSV